MDHNNTGTLSLIQELALDDFRRKSWPVANIYLIFSAVIPLALVYGSFVGLLTAGIIALVIVLVNTYSEFRDKVASCVAALGRSISGVFGTGRFATVMTSKRSKVALQNSKNRFGTEEQQQPYLRKSPAATTEGQSMGDGPLEDIGEDNNNMEDDISSLEDEFKGLPREDPIRRLTRAFKKKLEEQKEELKTKLQKVEAGVESCSEKVGISEWDSGRTSRYWRASQIPGSG